MATEPPDSLPIEPAEIPLLERLREMAAELTGARPIKTMEFAVLRTRTAVESHLSEDPVIHVMFSFDPKQVLPDDISPYRSLDEAIVIFRLECEVLDGGPTRVKVPSLQQPTNGVVTRRARIRHEQELVPLSAATALGRGSAIWVDTHITGNDKFIDLTREDVKALKPLIARLYTSALDEVLGPDQPRTPNQSPRSRRPNQRDQPRDQEGPTFPTMGL